MTLVSSAQNPPRRFLPSLSAGLLRRRRTNAMLWLMVAPLLIFIIVGYVLPVGSMLLRSIDNSQASRNLQATAAALAQWPGTGLPDDTAFEALAADLTLAAEARKLAMLGKYLEYEQPGMRKLVVAAGDRLGDAPGATARERLGSIDQTWLEPTTWTVLKRASQPHTIRNLLAVVDLRLTDGNTIQAVSGNLAIHLPILIRTFVVAGSVCLLTLLLGFPLALVISSAPTRVSKLLLILVLLPFWISVLVRTTAWIVLLQNNGVINNLLIGTGLLSEPAPLMFNRLGVIVAMTHVLLPFMVLPISNSMSAVPVALVRASLSLGAKPLYTFWRVYLPLVRPGIVSGCALVFINAAGYYITPALVGGPADQLVGYLVAFHTTNTLNWEMAAALSALILLSMAVLYVIIRFVAGPIDLTIEARR